MLTDIPLQSFIPNDVSEAGKVTPAAVAAFVQVSDLFGNVETHVAALMQERGARGAAQEASPLAAFVLGTGAAFTVAWEAVRSCHIQALISCVNRSCVTDASGALQSISIDTTCGLTFWTRGEPGQAKIVSELWRTISSVGQLDQFTSMTTPRLYGNKTRLTGFVVPIITTHLREGSPVLDLMSGTGVVSRALASRHPVSNNDANAYAALLTRSQAINGQDVDVPSVLSRLRDSFLRNHERLAATVKSGLEIEDAFLHGEITPAAVLNYAEFALAGPLEPTDGSGSGPARLVTERYANIYFGIRQSVELDSLRAAIQLCFPEQGQTRDLCLSALLLACTACSSGPHFAQPPKLKPALENASRSMRVLIERRARSVWWEFDLALARLAAREPLVHPFGSSTQLDWREALRAFIDTLGGREGGVYADPPYSKLQYSRYYHVLNVILTYGYPSVSGRGRYPPKAERFSSRFEYQPGGARREISTLLRECAEGGLTAFLSYSDGGFVPVETLALEMKKHFPLVEIFSEEVRHHSQGRVLKASRAKVIEHVLVGSHSAKRAAPSPD